MQTISAIHQSQSSNENEYTKRYLSISTIQIQSYITFITWTMALSKEKRQMGYLFCCVIYWHNTVHLSGTIAILRYIHSLLYLYFLLYIFFPSFLFFLKIYILKNISLKIYNFNIKSLIKTTFLRTREKYTYL